jgi:hypothetical protein
MGTPMGVPMGMPMGGPMAGAPAPGYGPMMVPPNANPYATAGMPVPMPDPATGEVQAGGPPCCCPGPYAQEHWAVSGEFLYMRPRDVNLPYGVIFSGPLNTPPAAAAPIQVAPPGTISFDYQPAWRAGFLRALDECSALQLTYTYFQTTASDSIDTTNFPGDLIRSMVSHPSTWTSNATSDFLSASATERLTLNLAAVDYRWSYVHDPELTLTLLAGAAYTGLVQDFQAVFTTSANVETVHTYIDFEGGGIRLGWEGERRGPLGLSVFGRIVGTLVAGAARAAYVQNDLFVGTEVNTGFHADRILGIADAQVGISWTSPNGHLCVSGGYMLSEWLNAVRTDEFIHAVQTNNFIGLGKGLGFDGFLARAELRF